MKHRFHLIAAAVAALLLATGPAPAGGQGLGALFDAGPANTRASTDNASTASAGARPRKRYKRRHKSRRSARRAKVEQAQPERQDAENPPEASVWPILTAEDMQKAAGMDPATFFADRFWFPKVYQPAILPPPIKPDPLGQ